MLPCPARVPVGIQQGCREHPWEVIVRGKSTVLPTHGIAVLS